MLNIDYNVVMVFTAIIFLQVVLLYAAYWVFFSKAGKPGWAILIPVYNILVLLQIVRKPLWWVFFIIIPVVNFVFIIWVLNRLIKSFGRTEGYTVGSVFFGYIFLPLLAFDKNAQYTHPVQEQ